MLTYHVKFFYLMLALCAGCMSADSIHVVSENSIKQHYAPCVTIDTSFCEVFLNVTNQKRESSWNTALTHAWHAESEVKIPYGRIDILTDTLAVEIDYFKKWKEGVGQSLYYAYVTKRAAGLALICDNHVSDSQLHAVKSFCNTLNIRLFILKNNTQSLK